MKIPPVLCAETATPAAEAVEDLIGACESLGRYIGSLPPSPEREAALQKFNECLLWSHQAILRGIGGSRILVADSRDIKSS